MTLSFAFALKILLKRTAHVCHQRPVRRHLGVAFEQDLVRAHFLRQSLRGGRVLPAVEVVRADVLRSLLFIVISLETVGHDDLLVVAGKILDERRRRLDDVAVEPEHPGRRRAEGGEEEVVARAAHGCSALFLVGEGVALGLGLRDGRLVVLALDGDGREAVLVGRGLRLLNALLQLAVGFAAFLALGDDEAQRDQVVRVAQLDEVVPVLLVEAREGREDQHALAVADWVGCGGDIVHVVVDHRRRLRDLVRVLLLEGQ